jgi:AraC-like DNA-binding protein
LAELAGILNIAPRTLDRYLSRESNNFRSISQNVRHQRACKLLRGGELPISQIAYKLGYSDAGNFSRAFSRIAGYSPTDFVNDGTVAAGQT